MEKYPPIDKQFQIMVLSGGRLAVTEIIQKRLKQMNKYKIAMSCGKGFGIVKTIEKTWSDIVTKLSKHIETNDKESVSFFWWRF